MAFNSGKERAVRPAKMTLEQFAEHHAQCAADKRFNTQREYRHAINHLIEVVGATARLDRIGRPEVAKLKATMQQNGLRPATIHKTVMTLRAAWNTARRDGLVTTNPFEGAGLRCDPKDSRIFSAEEVAAMLEVAPSDWWRCFLRLLSTSGLRLNEALHLRWEHLDFEVGTVRVSRQDGGRFTVDGQEFPLLAWSAKARSSYRTIPLPDETVTELQRYKLKAGRSAYVFVGLERLELVDRKLRNGKLRDNYELANNLLRRFKTVQHHARELLAKRRGLHIDKIQWRIGCLHDLRETFITSVKVLPLDVLKRVAGHSNVRTTLRYYTAETARDADDVRAALVSSGLAAPRVAAG